MIIVVCWFVCVVVVVVAGDWRVVVAAGDWRVIFWGIMCVEYTCDPICFPVGYLSLQ